MSCGKSKCIFRRPTLAFLTGRTTARIFVQIGTHLKLDASEECAKIEQSHHVRHLFASPGLFFVQFIFFALQSEAARYFFSVLYD